MASQQERASTHATGNDVIPLAAILLAAGASTRMGAVKALLPIDGSPAVSHLAQQFLTICAECVVVTGYHHAAVEATIADIPHVRAARNPAPELGQLSSLQTGLRALQGQTEGWFLFAPVDCFGMDRRVLVPLANSLASAPPQMRLCIPRHLDRRGHPVAVRWSMAAEFLALPPQESARSLIHQWKPHTLYVEIADGGFLFDADHPEDYRRFLTERIEGEARA